MSSSSPRLLSGEQATGAVYMMLIAHLPPIPVPNTQDSPPAAHYWAPVKSIHLPLWYLDASSQVPSAGQCPNEAQMSLRHSH
ncbi:hypothetical protein TrVGV298_008946 [Trichoderma virens]|nr:hypothetical protein TrVGV298_008946 [Trichoderma virens]